MPDSSKKQILTQLMITVTIIGGFLVLLAALGLHLNSSLDTVVSNKKDLDFRKTGAAELDSLIQQSEQATKIFDQLNSLLANKEQAARFPEKAAAVGLKNKVAVEIKLAEAADESGFLNFQLKATGAYSNLMNFLKNLETGSLLFAMDDPLLTRQDDHYLLEAKIKVFFK